MGNQESPLDFGELLQIHVEFIFQGAAESQGGRRGMIKTVSIRVLIKRGPTTTSAALPLECGAIPVSVQQNNNAR